MKKLESNLKNMFLSMLLICSVMAFALAFVYTSTKDEIEKANKEKEIQAVAQVLPKFDNEPVNEKYISDGLCFYPAKRNGKIIGIAVKSYSDKGFAGRIEIMVGFTTDNKIFNIKVMEQKETPGLGTKMTEPLFLNQFYGKNLENFKLIVKKDGGDVDAITAATISSRAFCDALSKAYNAYKNYISK